MTTTPVAYATQMNEQQRALYFAQMSAVQRDSVVGVLLAVFLGIFGAHHFYLRKTALGITYLVLSVTGIPMLLGWIEAFFMPGRVRRFNEEQAAWIAANIQGWVLVEGYAAPGYVPAAGFAPAAGYAPVGGTAPTVTCAACGASVAGGVNFCARCGAAVSAPAEPQEAATN